MSKEAFAFIFCQDLMNNLNVYLGHTKTKSWDLLSENATSSVAAKKMIIYNLYSWKELNKVVHLMGSD